MFDRLQTLQTHTSSSVAVALDADDGRVNGGPGKVSVRLNADDGRVDGGPGKVSVRLFLRPT